ncbi:hypothetical protein ACG5V6_08120 [Streptomyces chitinivorans]|uniref:RHS repeat-associated core domain-containing protein n=1 Tax=Streptomyces chitinivorans TaxID=1257027 RepID=A0ABW7HQR2_9ACTN
MGRFTQPDPSGQETNPYLYAAGAPINYAARSSRALAPEAVVAGAVRVP